jgi:chorismate mutase/prephenate dehydratase
MARPLPELRTVVDSIDDELIALLEKRASLVDEVAAAKREAGLPLHDPDRERLVLERLAARAHGKFPPQAISAVYREIMSACLALQQPMAVAYLGPEGTFSHMAARSLFGLGVRYVELPTIAAVADAVRRGSVDYGVAPIENSTEGSVSYTLDCLLDGGVHLRREWILPVEQALLGRATSLAAITRVISHPQAFGQCRDWLAKHLPHAQLVHASSTAAAAREAAGDPSTAAIASRLAAELHGLPVLVPAVQDRTENATRFVLLAKEDSRPTGDDKTTLAFSLRDGKGALRHVLEVFETEGVNLSRIESRPSREKAWDYVFIVDLEGHREDEHVARALAELERRCPVVRTFGSYPRAQRPT